MKKKSLILLVVSILIMSSSCRNRWFIKQNTRNNNYEAMQPAKKSTFTQTISI
ncbi:MAG: hypothetical protein V2A54_08365 [Bacteroidota bacterium]